MQRDGKNSPIESWVLKYIIRHGLSVKSMHGHMVEKAKYNVECYKKVN